MDFQKTKLTIEKLNSEEQRKEYMQKVTEKLSDVTKNMLGEQAQDAFRVFI